MHGRTGALTQTEALLNHALISLTIKQKYKTFEKKNCLFGTNFKSQIAPQRHTFCPYADELSKSVSALEKYVCIGRSSSWETTRETKWLAQLETITTLTNVPAGDDP